MRILLGTKGAMKTHYTDDGTAYAATVVYAGPCVVTQVKSIEAAGAKTTAVQIGFRETKKLRKPQQGHLKDLPGLKWLREFPVGDQGMYERGQQLTVMQFTPGDQIRVSGTSKGRGFQGVVKRHGFSGSPASHGHKDQLRMPGSIGATGPARVFKGMRMPGRMGGTRTTITHMQILAVDPAAGTLLIKGAIPGPFGGLLELRAPGDPTADSPNEEGKNAAPKAENRKESESTEPKQ